jgi:protein-disulfide isomerase
MKPYQRFLGWLAFACASFAAAATAQAAPLPVYVLGKDTAPVTVIEYASLTCSHCAVFYSNVMPEIEKNYIETGKVRFIYRDFPLDAIGLRASSLAHCMPKEQFYPFIKVLFKNYGSWTRTLKFQDVLVKYAEMSGMPTDKANSCIEDSKLMDAIVDRQKEAMDKYNIKATPTFVINDGAEVIVGAQTYAAFAATLDKHLSKK